MLLLASLAFLALGAPADPLPVPAPVPAPAAKHKRGGPVITNPDWIALPNGEDFETAYPQDARKAGVEGKAVLECLVTIYGTLSDCEVLKETPERQGFGAAAVSVAGKFRMRPKLVNGEAVGGAHVRIPILFRVDDEPALGPKQVERCLGYTEVWADRDQSDGVWNQLAFLTLRQINLSIQQKLKPSEMIARREAARLEAKRAWDTPEGKAEKAHCDELIRYYAPERAATK